MTVLTESPVVTVNVKDSLYKLSRRTLSLFKMTYDWNKETKLHNDLKLSICAVVLSSVHLEGIWLWYFTRVCAAILLI